MLLDKPIQSREIAAFLELPTEEVQVMAERQECGFVEPLEQRTLLSVSILNGGGLGYVGNGGGGPPDITGAAGPTCYLQSSNSNLSIYANKQAGTPIISQNPFTFFFSAGIGNLSQIDAGSQAIADVTMVYDELMGANGRFIIGDIDADLTTNVSQYVFAVSKSNNPTTLTTADWTFYHDYHHGRHGRKYFLVGLSRQPRLQR